MADEIQAWQGLPSHGQQCEPPLVHGKLVSIYLSSLRLDEVGPTYRTGMNARPSNPLSKGAVSTRSLSTKLASGSTAYQLQDSKRRDKLRSPV
ncbi:uncharacterized protein PgNI_02892 [Pyricularia grisea]|uniref:Uncharacterized protein n=1 Tax=Pyricularia grisea TaxID=148305 RepID=A0A6P8BDH4_PYRGI|nr:uncharacterized protein PgNI_02892 [Pyricularia grisea]TLD13863.1 hypothetical protein PgNI_02892 [Pyricularia grisea]